MDFVMMTITIADVIGITVIAVETLDMTLRPNIIIVIKQVDVSV
jgi:hypothetical protein